MKRYFLTCVAIAGFCAGASADSHESGAIQQLCDKVNALIGSMDAPQQAKLLMPMESPERMDWHYIPKDRKGIAWREMSPHQKDLSMDLVQALMSEAGMQKVRGVVASEGILYRESNQSDHRNPDNYHVTVFGRPDKNASWGASVEGHHLSINLTVVDGQVVSVTPSFMGANPDRSADGHQPLSAEMERARILYDSLDEPQQKQATLDGKPPREILTRSDRKVSPLEKGGLPASMMDKAQQSLLRQIMTEYIDRYREELAASDWAKINEAGFDNVTFLWASTPEPDKALYYRIQGPTFVIEYANAQNHGNHSHTVWRDFEGDFGHDALGAHMRAGN